MYLCSLCMTIVANNEWIWQYLIDSSGAVMIDIDS